MSQLQLFAAACLALFVSACTTPAAAPPPAPTPPTLGVFESQGDVGATGLAGSATFDPASGQYTVTGGGANIWGSTDAFHYVWTQRSGDLHVAADIDWVGAGHVEHRKAGVMIRQNLTPGSPYMDVMVHGNGLTSLQYRAVQDGPTYQIASNVTGPHRVQLEREGQYAYFSVSGPDGALHHAGGSFRLPLTEPYYVGLAVSGHDDTLTETAHFSNVDISVPQLATIADTGYAAQVEATLEVMDIQNGPYPQGNRRIVRHFDHKIEAPNWSRDGHSLIYNDQGHLYSIPVEGGDPTMINTGDRVKLNNDHGISPDGTQLVISDQSETDNLSRIYMLPFAGSDHPRLVAQYPHGRAYWHAWSPNGRTLIYVAVGPNNSEYDLHSIGVNGRHDRRLTTADGTDDGPEYTPDGQWVYFNSQRSGAMQIWRMKPDGSQQTQVTNDTNYRDWFPHLSPDGKLIAFVSFGTDVPLNDHPPNKDVMIRLMPTDGSSPPIVLTTLFGGQGTMNVPSWSPDGHEIAFVSYRLKR